MCNDAFKQRVGSTAANLSAAYVDLVSHLCECTTCASSLTIGLGSTTATSVCVLGRRRYVAWFSAHNAFWDARLARTIGLELQREAAAHAR